MHLNGKKRERKNLFLYICVRFVVQRTVRSLLLLLNEDTDSHGKGI